MIEKQPPSIPPYQGGSSEQLCSPLSGENVKAPPLIRGGREGFDSAFLAYNKNLTARARENRKNPTMAESKIWNEVLRKRQFAQYKFLRQKPIDNFIVDFYCSELRLVIEIDGDSHAETVEYDAERTKILEAFGLTVVRNANDEVLRNIQSVYEDLCEQVVNIEGKPPPLNPPLSEGEAMSHVVPPCRGKSQEENRDIPVFSGTDSPENTQTHLYLFHLVAPVAPAIRGYFSPVCAESKASAPTVTNNMSGLLMEVGATSRNIQDFPRQVDTYDN